MLSKLKTYALIAAAVVIILLAVFAAVQGRVLKTTRANADRLERNQSALLQELRTETNLAGNLQAEVDALTLKAGELERLVPSLRAKLADMDIRLKDAQHVAQVQMELAASVQARRDTVFQYLERPEPGRARYTYNDPWLTAVVTVEGDSVAALEFTARDSLTLVGHKERRRCIFKRPKITHYTVETASPYTTVLGMQYIEVVE